MFWHASKEKHGVRAWWHFRPPNRQIAVEVNWWARFCHLGVECGDEGWQLSIALPPVALWVRINLGWWVPTAKHIFTWDNNREVWLPDHRECKIAIHDWTIWLTPWGRWGEWRKRDPWWIRGVSLNFQRLVLGQRVYVAEELALVPCHVPMPEGNYSAVAKVQRVTRGFARWWKRTGQEVDLSIPKGIPFAGKGENSWDCGDDGLFGIGGDSIDNAIQRARDAVTERRRRYGHASAEAVREALS